MKRVPAEKGRQPVRPKTNASKIAKPAANPADASSSESDVQVGTVVPSSEPALDDSSEPVQTVNVTNVKINSATVYSVNSSRSAPLKVLQKGDAVQTDFEILDSEGVWSLIKGLDPAGSGYIRSEHLDRRQVVGHEAGEEKPAPDFWISNPVRGAS